MGKRRSSKPSAGDRVRVNEGVTMPEFPTLEIGGWLATVAETQGRGASAKVILLWDHSAIAVMPEEYRSQCESQNMLHTMACLMMSDVAIDD